MVGPRTPISIEKTKQSKTRGSQSSPTIGIRKPGCVQKHRERKKKGAEVPPLLAMVDPVTFKST